MLARIILAMAAATAAFPTAAQKAEGTLAEEAAAAGIGGVGLSPCADLVGVENVSVLAQAADWALGYMAGRIDAGDALVEGEPLDASSSTDIATGILLFCTDNPDATLLAATRSYGERVFGTEPVRRSFERVPARVPRPRPRPPGRTPETADATPDPSPPATPDATGPTE